MRLLAALLPSHLLVRLASHLDHLAHHDANVTLCQLGTAGKTKDVESEGEVGQQASWKRCHNVDFFWEKVSECRLFLGKGVNITIFSLRRRQNDD